MGAWISASDIRSRIANLDPRGTHTLDGVQDLLAGEACDWIERETGTKILRAQYFATFDGLGKPRLHLPNRQIRTVNALSINGQAVPAVPAAAFFGSSATVFWDNHSIVAPCGFPRGVANILVDYDAGYDPDTVPESYRGLACAVAILMLKERDRWGDQTKNLPGQTVTYVRTLPPKDQRTFDSLLDRRAFFPAFGGY